MEQELCHLVKLFVGQEHLLPFEPKADGSKKEHFLYLLLNRPFESKAFYKSELYDREYTGTGYEVLRSELQEAVLLRLSSQTNFYEKKVNGSVVSLVNQVHGLRLALSSGEFELGQVLGLVKSLLRKCEKYSLVLEQNQLLVWLIKNSGAWGCDVDFNKYRKKLEELRQVSEIKDVLDLNRAQLNLAARDNAFIHKQRLYSLESRLDECHEKYRVSKIKNMRLEYQILRQRMILAEAKKDFQSVLVYSIEGLRLSPNIPNVAVELHMTVYMALAYAAIGRFVEFLKCESKAESMLGERVFERMALAEISIVARIFRKEFHMAYVKLLSFHDQKVFEKISDDKKKLFRLFEEYLAFAKSIGLWNTNLSVGNDANPDAKSNEPLGIKSDKLGSNIGLIVLTVCRQLRGENFEALISMEESLKRYISRNLKMHDNRPSIFLKMLLKVIQLDFNSAEVEKKTKRLYLKLQEPSPGVNTEGNEIIRYEVLWEWILKKLRESSLLPKPKA